MAKQQAPPEDVVEGEVVEDQPAQPPPQDPRPLPVPHPSPGGAVTLFRTSDPVEVIEQATATATALKKVLDGQSLIQAITIKNRTNQHVRVEGWTLLGSMLGVYPVVAWTRIMRDDGGRRIGWEAKVEARTRSGELVGSGEAQCLRHEERWKSVDDYAVRSMAQTRATSKALKGPLGFIVQMAGYSSTPAEEAEGIADDAAHPAAEGEPEKPTIRDPDSPVTQNQVKLVQVLAGKLDLKKEDRHREAERVIKRKIRSFKDLKKGEASTLIDTWQKRIDRNEAGETAGGGGTEGGGASSSASEPEGPPPPSAPILDEAERGEWQEVLRQLVASELEEGQVLEMALERAAGIYGNRNKVLVAFNKGREPGSKARSTKQIPAAELLEFLLGGEG